MIYGVKLNKPPKEGQWVQFDTERGASPRFAFPAELPTMTSHMAQAEAALKMCTKDWDGCIVKLSLSWRYVR